MASLFRCQRCRAAGPALRGRKCAFTTSGRFTPANWQCETMNALRDAVALTRRDDLHNASIGIVPVPEGADWRGYVVLAWYKNRGTVGQALLVNDDVSCRLTLKVAEGVLGG
jgi:hypothetical protein